MAQAEQKAFDKPDEIREFPNGRLDLVQIGESEIGRLTLYPGWRWSEHVKPVVGDEPVVVVDWWERATTPRADGLRGPTHSSGV